MTEKVMSLSSGLVLGIAFALCLSIGTTQMNTSPLHMEYPALPELISINDLQSFHSGASSAPSRDTTPVITTAPPADTQGRIIRIATVTETADPVLSSTSTALNTELKDWMTTEDPKVDNALQQAHLQHSYIAQASETSASYGLIQVARQTNFTSIACGQSREGGQTADNGGQPSDVGDKPAVSGAPSITQSGSGGEGEGEGEGEGGGPMITGSSPRPHDPDDQGPRTYDESEDPHPQGGYTYGGVPHGGGGHPDPHEPGSFQQQGHRPEFD